MIEVEYIFVSDGSSDRILKTIENLPDPKKVLYELLITASELKGRRLHALSPAKLAHDVAATISDYTPLRALPAFQHLEQQVKTLQF
jgi:hypothetical protein